MTGVKKSFLVTTKTQSKRVSMTGRVVCASSNNSRHARLAANLGEGRGPFRVLQLTPNGGPGWARNWIFSFVFAFIDFWLFIKIIAASRFGSRWGSYWTDWEAVPGTIRNRASPKSNYGDPSVNAQP